MTSHDAAPTRPDLSAEQAGARWALVTGASGGIGQEFVRYLSAHGHNVVVTGRNVAKLDEAAQIVRRNGREVLVLPCDIADVTARRGLIEELSQLGITISTLVNNAGFGTIGEVATSETDRLMEEIEVNCTALTHLSREFLPGMLSAKNGTIINVASTASFQPLPTMAVYAATKAYVRSFSEALWQETQGTGVRVIALCPGPTETRFFDVAGSNNVLTMRRTSAQVIETCFAGLKANKPTVIDGPLNVVQAQAPRFAPTRFVLWAAKQVVKPR